MSYLVLARKYRPQTFEDVVGQAHITQTLKNAIRADRVAHALLFAGPRGVGKTSVARILAKAMNCRKGPTPTPCNACKSCEEITQGIAVDVFEIDGASNRGIDEIRELRENIKYMSRSRFKIYIIDEVHMLTAPAFNALLKTLEEPPAHVLFIFATTEPNKIPITILSRCQRHEFRRIRLEDIVEHLKYVCNEARFEISEEGLRVLAGEAGGSMRDALSLLDQLMVYSEGGVTDEQILDSLGAVDRKVLFDLSTALLGRDLVKALDLLEGLYNYGHDLKRLYGQILEHFRHLLVVKMADASPPLVDVPAHEIGLMEQQVEHISLESLNQIFSTLFEAEASIRLSAQTKLALEALLIKVAQFMPVVSFDEIISKLDSFGKRFETPCGVSGQSEVREATAPESRPASEHKAASGRKPDSGEDLAQTWQQLVSILKKQSQPLVPVLEKAVLTKVGENFLELSVQGNSFYTARLRDKKSMATIEKVCNEFFNRRMRIKVVDAHKEASQEGQHRESDRTRHLKKEALSHPIVTDALEVFQGRVVDVKIP
ncbi:MAG: DNA polymerase III subunit gamma/tau [Desulfobacterales bacterium]|nr:DNA polymerase III subunit gamma/tau [Desulfobacterales bacterium]